VKSENKRIPLTNNEIIEKELGKHGIICIEDMIAELIKFGENAKKVISFLW